MLLLGFSRKYTALALCKSFESAIQWFQIHHKITFVAILNSAVYLSGERVSIFPTLVPRLGYSRLSYHFSVFLSWLQVSAATNEFQKFARNIVSKNEVFINF